MPFPEDAEDLQVQFAFGHSAAEDPTGLTFETVSPASADDPGPALGPVLITAGRIGNASTTTPTRVQFGLRNTGGEFSQRNVTGDRYGTLRRGTPLQVTVDLGDGPTPLATAAQPAWTPTRLGPDIDRQVPVDALGVLALLGRDDEPVSPLSRIGRAGRAGLGVLRGWWPLESGKGELTSTPSGMDGGTPAVINSLAGNPAFTVSADGLPGASGAMVLPAGASLLAPLQNGSPRGPWRFEVALKISSQALEDRIVLYAPDGSRYLSFLTSGTNAVGFALTAGGTTNNLTGTAIIADGKWHWVTITMIGEIFGLSTAEVFLHIDDVEVALTGTVTVASGDIANYAISNVSSVSQVFHWRYTGTDPPASPDLAAIAAQAYAGEQAHERIERLLIEAGYPSSITGTESARMGAQPTDGLLNLIREAERTDEGMLIELRNGLVGYLCRASLENQTDPWTIPFEQTAGVWPDYSDQFLRNEITARSPDGYTATVEAEGALSPDPSTGIGRRPAPIDRNPYQPASNLVHNAGYALARATQEKPRCRVGINLHGEPQLAEEWLERFIGARLIVTDLPEQEQQDLGPGDLDLIIVGCQQYLDAGVWALDLMCEPYELFDVGVYAQDLPINDFAPELVGWRDYDTCVLAVGVNSSAPSWSVTCSPADSSAANDFPRRHFIGGELVTVTASTGGTSPTWTVTRSVNGVVKAHSSAAEITLADPLILTL